MGALLWFPVMGVTRRWEYLPNATVFAEAWPNLVREAQAIIDAVADRGILLTGPAGDGDPVCNIADGIAFVDGEYDGMKTDVFRIEPPYHGTSPGSCHTDDQPYDLAVTAILFRFAQLLPGMWVNSGGDTPTWKDAIELSAQLFNPKREAPVIG